jgi:hypothetical protein
MGRTVELIVLVNMLTGRISPPSAWRCPDPRSRVVGTVSAHSIRAAPAIGSRNAIVRVLVASKRPALPAAADLAGLPARRARGGRHARPTTR